MLFILLLNIETLLLLLFDKFEDIIDIWLYE